MEILCFQHHDDEHAGHFRALLVADGHTLHTVMLHRGDAIPDPADFDAMWVLGGPMDVWQTDQHPWLIPEIEAIRTAVLTLGKPYFGLCLGHQLLAVALGGSVAPGTPEIGVLPIALNEAGTADDLLVGAPQTFQALQWHSAEVTEKPADAKVLATSPECAIQALRFGAHALSFQFHLEAEADTVKTWNAVPEYRAALLAALGENGASALDKDVHAVLPDMNLLCERLYVNWMAHAVEKNVVDAG